MQVASTYLKRDAGNIKNNLGNSVQLIGVNILLILREYGTTDLCEGNAVFNCPFHEFLH